MTMICKRGVRITQYIHYQGIARKVEELISIWVPLVVFLPVYEKI